MEFVRKIAIAWLLAVVGFLGGIGIALQFNLLSEPANDDFSEEAESTISPTSSNGKPAVASVASSVSKKSISAITDRPAHEEQTIQVQGATLERKVYDDDLSSLENHYLFALLHIQGKTPEARAVLLSNDQVVHEWHVADLGKAQYYISSEVQPDGSLLLSQIAKGETGNEGKLSLVNACSKISWSKDGTYQFYPSLPAERYKWLIEGDNLVQADLKTGAIVKTVNWDDVRLKNPNSHLDLLLNPASQKWADNPWDIVDVEPLPAKKQSLFPIFNAGDLLIAFRQISLLVVIDPETLEIKWWSSGTTRKPVDVDWLSDGTIGASNGNTRVLTGSWKDTNRYSNFVQIDPAKYEITKKLEFSGDALYSPANFTHQLLEGDDLLINSEGNNKSYTFNENNELLVTLSSVEDGRRAIIKDTYWVNKNFFIKDINEVSGQCKK